MKEKSKKKSKIKQNDNKKKNAIDDLDDDLLSELMAEEDEFQKSFKKPIIQPPRSRIIPPAEDSIQEESLVDDDEIQLLDNFYKKGILNNEVIVLEHSQPKSLNKDTFLKPAVVNQNLHTKKVFNNSINNESVVASNLKSKPEIKTDSTFMQSNKNVC